jgi:hypothetical protein
VNILCSRYVLVRTQPAAKILALLVPREHKVEHSNALKNGRFSINVFAHAKAKCLVRAGQMQQLLPRLM